MSNLNFPLSSASGCHTAADVPAAEPRGTVDPVNRGVGAGAGGGEILAECGDTEHAAARGEQPPFVAAGAGVEDLDLRVGRGGLDVADLAAMLGRVGVA